MATSSNTPSNTIRESDTRDIPESRSYDEEAIKELDQALEEALEAAENADHEYLTHLLECELSSLYYEQKLGV